MTLQLPESDAEALGVAVEERAYDACVCDLEQGEGQGKCDVAL